MGVRPYDPTLGRFLAVDPVEGGSCNNYDYTCQDAINGTDYSGKLGAPNVCGIVTAKTAQERAAASQCMSAFQRDSGTKLFAKFMGYEFDVIMAIVPIGKVFKSIGWGVRLFSGGQRTVKLFRAISTAEAGDIRASGVLRTKFGGMEGKHFWLTLEDAIRFRRVSPNNSIIVEVEAPVAALDDAIRVGNEGDAVFVLDPLLSQFRNVRIVG